MHDYRFLILSMKEEDSTAGAQFFQKAGGEIRSGLEKLDGDPFAPARPDQQSGQSLGAKERAKSVVIDGFRDCLPGE